MDQVLRPGQYFDATVEGEGMAPPGEQQRQRAEEFVEPPKAQRQRRQQEPRGPPAQSVQPQPQPPANEQEQQGQEQQEDMPMPASPPQDGQNVPVPEEFGEQIPADHDNDPARPHEADQGQDLFDSVLGGVFG